MFELENLSVFWIFICYQIEELETLPCVEGSLSLCGESPLMHRDCYSMKSKFFLAVSLSGLWCHRSHCCIQSHGDSPYVLLGSLEIWSLRRLFLAGNSTISGIN